MTHDWMTLNTVWFALIAVLWIGYFFLEGFDFGVGILLPFCGRDKIGRRVVVNSIGPFWDGNEVWLLVAGGATFAAFPQWYATLFSGFYLALFIILLALIVRGVAFEYRGKRDSDAWTAGWDWCIFFGSLLPAALWGVAFANILHGVPVDSHHEYTGSLLDLLNPYGFMGGVTTLLLFTLHGANYLALKTGDDVRELAETYAKALAWPAAAALVAFLLWTFAYTLDGGNSGQAHWAIPVAALALICFAPMLTRNLRPGAAFLATGGAIALTTVTLFLNLFPRVLVSSTDSANSLDVFNAASSHYTLTVMTVVAVIFTPIVLLYQAWTYWVFRQRLTRDQFELPSVLRKNDAAGRSIAAPAVPADDAT